MKENQLDVMFPQGKVVRIKNEDLTIKPFKLGDLPKVFRAVDPISGLVFKMLGGGQVSHIQAITTLLGEGGENILDIIAIGSKKPIEWVNELEGDEGVDLLTAIVEVNADFFIRKVLPKLNQNLETIAKAGQTS